MQARRSKDLNMESLDGGNEIYMYSGHHSPPYRHTRYRERPDGPPAAALTRADVDGDGLLDLFALPPGASECAWEVVQQPVTVHSARNARRCEKRS